MRSVGITVADSWPRDIRRIARAVWNLSLHQSNEGTGLGLAIVRKRMEEAAGQRDSFRLLWSRARS